ncbi:MAG TPA: alpha/beta hydrolase [Aggregatilineales bacterium]|nr:alpha/beta hydrolase [Aggregatilineales bacterium]
MPGITWADGYDPLSRASGTYPGTQTARYSLRTLADRGLVDRGAVNQMLIASGLADFHWRVVWADEGATSDADINTRVSNVDGYVIFIHGWTGTNEIWEDLPGLIVTRNPHLVALVADHNGFGGTPFTNPMPDFEHCSPIGAMRAIERWLDVLKLRREPGERHFRTINFVGHSMGGAALFFLNETRFGLGEQTRTAIAPALLLRDEAHRAFYTTLGLGIGLVGRLRALDVIDHALAPTVLEVLTDGATDYVRDEHGHVYEATPKSVTARTFAAMGVITEYPQAHSWQSMQVILGHRDRLVGLIPMLDLLQELDFGVDQVRVVMGTHYLFSLGTSMQKWHTQNRVLVVEDILKQHAAALKRQKTG